MMLLRRIVSARHEHGKGFLVISEELVDIWAVSIRQGLAPASVAIPTCRFEDDDRIVLGLA